MKNFIKKYGFYWWLEDKWVCWKFTFRSIRWWRKLVRNTYLPYSKIVMFGLFLLLVWIILMSNCRTEILIYQYSYYTTPEVIHVDRTVSRVEVDKSINGVITHYSADESQTDQSPCLTADMTNICHAKERIVANNCLAFGTVVEIQGIEYRVADRMNKRFGCENFDILAGSRKEAIRLGKVYAPVLIHR